MILQEKYVDFEVLDLGFEGGAQTVRGVKKSEQLQKEKSTNMAEIACEKPTRVTSLKFENCATCLSALVSVSPSMRET